jgi:glucose-6-phosphate-specific signal transduction histidine kinase
VHILVKGPFWRTWWFLGFVLLALAAFLYWLDRQRMQKKAAMESMRSEISRNLHEEVNQALQNINVLSEIARIRAQKHPQQSISYIDEIHHKSHNMIIAMDDMLWSIDPANDTMDKAIDRMREFAGALSRRENVRIEVQADDEVRTLRPDMKIRHEFLLIYKLALRMLVEEIKVSTVLAQLDYQRPHLHLTIFSSELGSDLRNTRYFRLLEEMRSRAQAIHGTLEIQYEHRGAAILLICPSIF